MENLGYHISYFLQVLVLSFFWVYRLKRRPMFLLRLICSTLISFGLVVLISFFESLFTVQNWIVFSMPYMLIMALYGIMYRVCFDIPLNQVLLTLLLPTTAQLCGNSIKMFINYNTSTNTWAYQTYLYDAIVTLLMLIVSFVLVKIFKEVHFYDNRIYKIALISGYSIVLCIFALNAFSPSITDRFTRYVVVAGYRFLMSAFVFFLIFSLLMLSRMLYQKNTAEILLKKEGKQHALTGELVELINIKYHDIKHLQNSNGADGYLNQDSKLLDIYELLVDCGNVALNTILSEKNVVCNNNSINFTMMVDGGLLDFMLPIDIYALFGNAVDNAIEHLLTLPESERSIKLQVKRVQDMVSINCENTCHEILRFEKGLPQTTKDDYYNHGFGTKSIASVCKKYNAQFQMSCDGELFALEVLIPIK